MNRITRLKIENFRRLKSLDLEMRPLGVMIGANGCGKTSIFDALSLLKAAVEGKLSETISKLGGFSSNVTLDGSETMTLGIGIGNDPECTENEDTKDVYYEIELSQEGQGHGVAAETLKIGEHEERLTEVANKRKSRGMGQPPQTNIASIARSSEAVLPLADTMESLRGFHVLNARNGTPVRLPQQITPEFLPGQDGKNLLSSLYNLREQNPEAFEGIIATLKIAFPGFESLAMPNVAAGMMSLAWNDRNFRDALYQHQMSEGMLRMLWLTTILLNPHLTPLTLIDEPEVSLHPELLAILAACFRKATTRTQLLAATHSTGLVRNLHPAEVLVLDVDENGMTTARWGDDPELIIDDWLTDYNLGDIWEMGLLGGRA